ncbi:MULTISPECIES: Fe(3+)-hydroxamate ABC transporter permease FhuB [Ensifer]|jgi:ferric hydroxamate transport system permease protein|uniref:Fe(3+)-hydroxamate ABC transporter permease FhuB n=1 Tax=Ensifer TaxID=106591 RepID=UPI00071105AD|nr:MULTISPECIES: Fe(3+)-hydroxamate ABC transporter permease FhuB [Ensifer]KQU82611.1 ABC transporter permease [Ensifer sp. Root31]KQW59843.1 ABC transporter permease [Ensifer sp. Root1252]KQW78626.1 ABC transporter permease [Ensifer sp. Root127]KQY67132.1 ABC transporter permease [Ensifer sp. Root142]KRC74046.1 ABC transporter permease [Ensifer sp. Root231]
MTMRTWSFLSASVLAGLILFALAASNQVPFAQWGDLSAPPAELGLDKIILAYSLFPRAAVALVAGAALGLSGALLQQLLRNPLADPSTLGISAGAQLAIVAATLYVPEIVDGHRTLVALAGAAGAAAIVFALGWRRAFEPVTMVVSGLLVGVTAAAFSAAITLARGEYLMSLVTWNGGSLTQQDWSVFQNLGSELVLLGLLAGLLIRPLMVLGLGDTSARSLGVNLGGIRFAIAAIATALAGSVAAAAGLVSFVGLAAPAFVRACGARRPAMIVALSPVAGALFLWLCDGIVQTVARASSENFPTGAVTALVGGPLLLWLLPRVRSMEVPHEARENVHRSHLKTAFAAFLFLVPVLVAIAFFIGPSGHGWKILNWSETLDLAPLRWPRLLASAAAGGLLAVTGAVLQRMTGNAMASPEVVGVSGGAGLGFAAALTFAPDGGTVAVFTGSGLGALIAMLAVLVFASRRHLPPEKLLLAGVAVGSFSSAVLSALLAIGDQRSWQILSWLGGSASTATPATAIFLCALSLLVLVAALILSRWLTILPFGPSIALSLGLSVRLSRVVLLLLSGAATGAASLLVGPLSFVGLVAPHIALRAGLVTAPQHLAGSFLLGSILMALADFGARTATFPYELPLGLFAALVGAPYLIWLLGRQK